MNPAKASPDALEHGVDAKGLDKAQAFHHERAKLGTGMPPSLTGLSEEEYNIIGLKTTRKIDILIMPALIIMYIASPATHSSSNHNLLTPSTFLQFNYLDRQNLAAAKLAGINEDLGMSEVQYKTCISLLFILMQTPSNMIASKIRWPAFYICSSMCVWGALSAATAAVQSFGALLACRFILGFCESVFFPGALFFLSTFYTKKQYATRVALLYSGSQLGNAFGGLFAIAILKLDGRYGIDGWRWLFVIEGVATVGLAAIFASYLPNSPATCRWLTEVERDHLMFSLRVEQGASDSQSDISGWQGLTMAVMDPKTWLLMAILYCTYIGAAVVSFFPTVVGTLGYTRTITYVLTAPPYLLTCVAMTINGWHSDKTQERFWHIVGPLCVAVLANIIAVSTLSVGGRYVAMMLMPTSYYSAAIVILSWISSSITQPTVKRATAMALINSFCNTPNVWTTYLYTNGPRFTIAFAVNLAASCLAIAFAVLVRVYLMRKNAELDRGDQSARGAPTEEQCEAGFRYLI